MGRNKYPYSGITVYLPLEICFCGGGEGGNGGMVVVSVKGVVGGKTFPSSFLY